MRGRQGQGTCLLRFASRCCGGQGLLQQGRRQPPVCGTIARPSAARSHAAHRGASEPRQRTHATAECGAVACVRCERHRQYPALPSPPPLQVPCASVSPRFRSRASQEQRRAASPDMCVVGGARQQGEQGPWGTLGHALHTVVPCVDRTAQRCTTPWPSLTTSAFACRPPAVTPSSVQATW